MQDIVFSKWDFEVTGTKVYKLINFNDMNSLEMFITTDLNKDEFIFTRIDSDDLDYLNELSSIGFYLTDFLATFQYFIKKNQSSVVDMDSSIKEITYEDTTITQQCLDIVKNEFLLGHLFNDRNLNKFFAKKIYTAWCINNLKGRAKTFAYIMEGKLVGFLQVIERSKDILQIDLICVRSSFQNKGIGNKLIDYSLSYATSNNYKEVIVGTQETNFKAVKFYTSKGFVKYKSEVSLHFKK